MSLCFLGGLAEGQKPLRDSECHHNRKTTSAQACPDQEALHTEAPWKRVVVVFAVEPAPPPVYGLPYFPRVASWSLAGSHFDEFDPSRCMERLLGDA